MHFTPIHPKEDTCVLHPFIRSLKDETGSESEGEDEEEELQFPDDDIESEARASRHSISTPGITAGYQFHNHML